MIIAMTDQGQRGLKTDTLENWYMRDPQEGFSPKRSWNLIPVYVG